MNNKNLFRKKIILGITGGIAIYKVCDLVRKLTKLSAEVKCIMTVSATKLISPLLFEQLSGNKVYTEMFESPKLEDYSPTHISLSDWADLIIVIPCSCNTISKLATGKTEDLLSCTIYACDLKKTKIMLCPSMNTNMWEHPITQKNVALLKDVGYQIIMPEEGELLCKKTGIGRLPEINKIVEYIEKNL